MQPFQVCVAKESLGFSAAHFLTLPGHMCQRLHGHNYRVAVTLDGDVDHETGFVVDFALLKRVVKALIEPMDHRVLVPGANPKLRLRDQPGRLVVDYDGQNEWMVVPREHACVLPVTNTTAELLAEWLAKEVRKALDQEGVDRVRRLVVELEESTGQSASAIVMTKGSS